MKKRILSIITAVALTIALLPAAAVPASAAGTTRTVSTSEQFHDALKTANDGDTIQVSGSIVVKNPVSNNDSLVIDKAVTIQGGSLTLWYSGILLGADVTFKDITLGLGSNMRNAIMANGHTLTLENVQRDPTCRYIHLFCGGQTGATQGTLSDTKQGSHGKIILKGNTNLGQANIYAGSISTDGQNNVFTGDATVTIDPLFKGQPIEHIYACGAVQTSTNENDWFDYEREIDPPCPYPGNFKVSGAVTFNLYQDRVGKVEGDTGISGQFATVNYKGSGYLNDTLMLSKIAGLNVESGNLQPLTGEATRHEGTGANGLPTRTVTWNVRPSTSCFGSTGVPLSISSGATLGLQKLGDVTVGDFTGGGSLVLGQSQKLTVAGAVSGTTTVGIGGIFNGHSQEIPTEYAIYIDAARSTENSFTLAAPASRPDIKLVKGEHGEWTAVADADATIVNDFTILSVETEVDAAELPCLLIQNVQFASTGSRNKITFIPLEIKINGNSATWDATWDDGAGGYIENKSGLAVAIADNDYGTEEVLQVSCKDLFSSVPAGVYLIEVTVPAANSGTGQPIIRTAALTVKAASGQDTPIPVPTASEGLVYNGKEQVGVSLNDAYVLSSGSVAAATEAGEYETKVTPATGFTWENGGGTVEKTISWSIAKADNLKLPTGLGLTAPSAYGASDGKITGTTAEMEYSKSADFSNATNCAAPETTGLQAGDYYVRIAGSRNYKAGPAVMVTVPQGPLTVQSIAISSTGHKTAYKVGDPLDVTGLTLTATMSNNSTYLVPVAVGMVSGFDSSSALQSQTLTVTYGGRTTTYTITIEVDLNPVTSITITSTGHKTAYKVGDFLDVAGLKLTVTRQDGATEEVNVLANMVTGFDSRSPVDSQTLTVTYGGQTTSYTITIEENTGTGPIAVTGVTLNKSSTTLTVGSSERLTATVSPDTAANKNVTWASQNTAVATVDAAGTVTAVGAGTAVITVTTADGGKTASCTVTVSPNGGGGSSGGSSGSSGGGSSSGGSSSGGSSSNTTTNADGSVTTTVTDKKTGTVTTTTKKPDGSTMVVEAKKDGTVTITDTAQNGVKVEAVSKPETDTSARVTLPTGVKTAAVTVPVAVTPGTVAVDAKTGEIVKLSAPTGDGMTVKLEASADLILVDRSKPFTDTGGHWAKDAIDFATAHAMFNGTSSTTFSPDDAMTRGMIAVVLHNFEGSPDSVVHNDFTDVASGMWYADAINWIADKGIASGYGSGSFGANDSVTREQLVTILYRYANVMGYSTQASADLSAFPDGASVSTYASEAMCWAVGSGLIVGTDGGVLDPGGSATRAQVASILNRFVLNLMK